MNIMNVEWFDFRLQREKMAQHKKILLPLAFSLMIQAQGIALSSSCFTL